ncbi:hypothetical protein [Natronobacterium texcoconense]|uniref:Uncharacterized protein n=1 Tax=Natronobacterium texcoconense TaxID=1095778 RepID=A0A1H1FQP1_NATTX|nr:hypothetical protein [Natronobacterium texcoconense]SDR03231.1 hypothetical protein SAMN04489842_2072 [Natronobacterium texcoconense]
MAADDDGRTGLEVSGQRDWFRFGVYIAFLYAGFTLVILYLLQFDTTVGLVVAVVGSILYGIGIMVYVLYFT